MNFDFSDEQKSLGAEARRVLSLESSMARVRQTLNDPGISYDALLWKKLAELGWLGLALPETWGGSGLGFLELAVLAEEFGRANVALPVSSTLYGFAPTLLEFGDEAQKARYIPRIADGSCIACLAFHEGPGAWREDQLTTIFEIKDGVGTLTGTKIPVTDGDIAHVALVIAREGSGQDAGISLFLVDLNQAHVTRERLGTIDPTRSHAKLVFHGATAERLGAPRQGSAIWESLLDRMAILLSFEQIGGADRCLEMAVDYAKNRYAFGRQIGSFQAIKHKLADIYVKNQLARSNAYFGAWALSARDAELPIAAASARVCASDAYDFAAKENIQTHGGMGFTFEADCHLFLRRARLLGAQIGAAPVWREKLVRRLERRNAA